ncbi:MAG: glycoside hydrolase family 18 protein [Balneolaceae bacterium]|nr:glycoside hydrolase family 18 protein [Balneolaceae bacterium]
MNFHFLNLFLTLIAGLILFSGINTSENDKSKNRLYKQSETEYKIIGYVAGWRSDWTTDKIDATKLTHINYAFADVLEDGQVVSMHEQDAYNFAVLDSLKLENPDLKILISLGGWTRSTWFSDAVLTEESRRKFAESAVDFVKEFGIDGVDIDWEYPGSPGAGNVFRAVDKENFTLMLKELREHLDEQGRIEGREGDPYLLTIATGASRGFLENTEMHKAHQYLDFINLMTYDYHTGGSPVAGHHTNLYPSASIHYTRGSTDQSVQWYIDAGIPSDKLVLGVAFYGRYWTEARNKDNGLYQFAPNGDRGSISYDNLRDNYINRNGFTRHWDAEAKAPWLWNSDTQTFVTYDDEESLRHKTHYIRARGLGGAMFWEYSQNLDGELLNALYEGLND